jgi:hypothetical protein
LYLKYINIIIFGFFTCMCYMQDLKIYAMFEENCSNPNNCIIITDDELTYNGESLDLNGFGDYDYLYLNNSKMTIIDIKIRFTDGAYFTGDNIIEIIDNEEFDSFMDIYYLRGNGKVLNNDKIFEYYLPDMYLENSYFKVRWWTDFDGITLPYESSIVINQNISANSRNDYASQYILDLSESGNNQIDIHYLLFKGNYTGFVINDNDIRNKYGLEIIIKNYNTINLTNESNFNNVDLIVSDTTNGKNEDQHVIISGNFTNSLLQMQAQSNSYSSDITLNGNFNLTASTILLESSSAINIFIDKSVLNLNFNVISESVGGVKSNLVFVNSTSVNFLNATINNADLIFKKSNTEKTVLNIDDTMKLINTDIYIEDNYNKIIIEGDGVDNFSGVIYLGGKDVAIDKYSQHIIIQNISNYSQTFIINGEKDLDNNVEYYNIEMLEGNYILANQLVGVEELIIHNSNLNFNGELHVNSFNIVGNTNVSFSSGSKVFAESLVLVDTKFIVNNNNVDSFVIGGGVSSYNSVINVLSDDFFTIGYINLLDASGMNINNNDKDFMMEGTEIVNQNSFLNIGEHSLYVLSYFNINNQRTKTVNTVGLVLEVDVLNNTNGILNVSSSANVNANIISVNLLNVDDNYYTGEYNVIHSEGGDVNSEAFVIVDNPNYRAEFVVDETGKNGYVKIICVNPLTDSTCDSSFGTTENLNNDACSIESLNAVNLQNNINNIMYDSSYGDDLKNVMNILNADYDNYSKNMINMMPMLNTNRILNLREINLGYNSSFGLVSESNNKADYFLRYDSYFSDGLHWFWNVKSVNYRDSASCNNVNKMYSNGFGTGFSYNIRVFDFFMLSTGMLFSVGELDNSSSSVLDVTTNKNISYINNSGLFFNLNLFLKYFVYGNYLSFEIQETTIFNNLNRKINIPILDNNNYANFTDMLIKTVFEYGLYLDFNSMSSEDNRTFFNPFFRIDYSYYILNEYSEDGYGANYHVMKDTISDVSFSVGLRVNYYYELDAESKLSMEMNFDVSKYLNHEPNYTTVYFEDDFLHHTVSLQNPYYDSMYANFGLESIYYLNKSFKLNFLYQYRFSYKFKENIFGLGLRYLL